MHKKEKKKVVNKTVCDFGRYPAKNDGYGGQECEFVMKNGRKITIYLYFYFHFHLSSAHICIYLYIIFFFIYSRESDPSIITNGCTRMWYRQRKFFVIKHFASTKWIQFSIAFIVFVFSSSSFLYICRESWLSALWHRQKLITWMSE